MNIEDIKPGSLIQIIKNYSNELSCVINVMTDNNNAFGDISIENLNSFLIVVVDVFNYTEENFDKIKKYITLDNTIKNNFASYDKIITRYTNDYGKFLVFKVFGYSELCFELINEEVSPSYICVKDMTLISQ